MCPGLLTQGKDDRFTEFNVSAKKILPDPKSRGDLSWSLPIIVDNNLKSMDVLNLFIGIVGTAASVWGLIIVLRDRSKPEEHKR